MSVGPNQHDSGGSDHAKDRKLPNASVFSVDQLNTIRPRRDVEAAGLTKVEQHRPGLVQEGEYSQRAAGGDQVEIGYAAPEQRVSLTKVVMNVQAGDHCGDVLARFIHRQHLSKEAAKRDRALVV